jgi:hypothetical protein
LRIWEQVFFATVRKRYVFYVFDKILLKISEKSPLDFCISPIRANAAALTPDFMSDTF